MHKPIYETTLRAKAGKLWLHVTAIYRENRLEVFKKCEDGRAFCRNMYYRNMAGYCVTFPGEIISLGYGYGREESVLEPWGDCLMDPDPEIFEATGSSYVDEKDREAVIRIAPNFRYILDKCPDLSCAQVLKLMPIYREHPNVELLLQAGFKKIAFNKSFYRLSKNRQRQVLEFLRKNPGKDPDLCEVLTIIRSGATEDEYNEYRKWCWIAGGRVSFEVYKYLCNLPKGTNKERLDLYRDYIKMAKRCGHDVKNDYWKYPKNLRAAHNKVLKQLPLVIEAEEKDKNARKQAAYLKAVKRWLKKNVETADGVRVWVPETIAEIKAQAETLHQCLISCDYVSKVIKRDCLLVFIAKKGKPLATAQIMKNGTLGQFYGDEANRNKCAPSKVAREALKLWQDQYLEKAA